MRIRELSAGQRWLAGCGCVMVLAVAAAALLFGVFSARIGRMNTRQMESAPAGWTDSLRIMARLPDLTGFALPRTEAGDGSAVAHDSTLFWNQQNVEHAYRALINPAVEAFAADSAAWRMILADTALGRFVRAAARRDWNATARVYPESDTLVRRNLLRQDVPNYRDIRNVTRALVIRGLLRLSRGDREAARADFAAATSLGEQMFRDEPNAFGALIGRAAISSSMRGWERYAESARDSATAGRARAILAWAGERPGRWSDFLIAAPDSAFGIAEDSTLALGFRADALGNVITGWIVRPRGFLLGPPARVRRRLASLSRSADRDFAVLAGIAGTTADRMRWFGVVRLVRELESPPRN